MLYFMDYFWRIMVQLGVNCMKWWGKCGNFE